MTVQMRSITSTLIVTLITAVVSILTIVVTARVIGPLPISLSQTIAEKHTTFDVTGESEQTVVPDTAQVTLGVEIKRPSIAQAQDESNTTTSRIIDQLTKLGVNKDDIQTQNYSVFPEYDYTSPSRRITGYMVQTSLRVEVSDFAILNQVIDSATAAGANQVSGVSFTLSTEAKAQLKKNAREQAIDAAQANAKELASLSGMRLGRIVNIAEQQYDAPVYPMFARSAVMDMKEGAAVESMEPTQIEPGSQTFKYSVVLSYETL